MPTPDATFRFAAACGICGCADMRAWRVRADGIDVLACRDCTMGVVSVLPSEDLLGIYDVDYYRTAEDSTGYGNYTFTADHSTSWAAAAVTLLAPSGGRVLDIGCADGYLLDLLPTSYERHGIEASRDAAEVAQRAGVRILGHDVLNLSDAAAAERFDVITAVAVFEHVEDIRRATETAIGMLAPGGVLVFEVPVLPIAGDAKTWLTTSLEHVWYPTESGLRRLFSELGHIVHGGEVSIREYASTFVGFVSADETRDAELEQMARQLLDPTEAPAEHLVRTHALLQLVHAANGDPVAVRALPQLVGEDGVLPAVRLRRLADVWSRDALEYESVRADLQDVRGYVEQQEASGGPTREEALQEAVEAATKAAHAAELANIAYAELKADHDDAVRQLQETLGSTSWRLAAPVRAVGDVRRRARALRAVLPLANRRRVLTAVQLVLRGDMAVLRRRLAALSGVSAPSWDEGEVVLKEREPWPTERPLVSVVIPCFNYGAFVRDAVESVLRQTLPRVEVTVVDGGSTDPATLDVLRAMESEYAGRVRFLFREGRHFVGDNRNFGITASGGKYVCCLDADDLLEPTYLEMAFYLLERRDYDVVSTAIRLFGREDRVVGVLERPALADMLDGNHVTTVGVCRRTDWERSGGYHDTGTGKDHVHEDWKYWQRMVALGARVRNIAGEPLFLYRSHSDTSLSRHAEMPDLLAQRDAVRAFNADVITTEALAASSAAQAENRLVRGSWADLAVVDERIRGTILLCAPFLLVGGQERMMSQALAHLTRSGFRVAVVTTVPTDASHGDSTAWFQSSTAEIYPLPRLLPPAGWLDFLDHVIATKSVDVLWQAGSEYLYRQLPTIRANHPRVKVVDSIFNTGVHASSNIRQRSLIDMTVAESTAVGGYLRAHGVAADRLRVVPNGVDVENFHPRDDGAKAPTLPLRVGWSGRLSEEKDPLAFVEVARALRSRSDYVFEMAGAGPLEADVTSAIRRHRLSNIAYLGLVEDVAAYTRSLDVLVLPSRIDGRPNAALEALASGVPVLASRVGGLPELVTEDETGWLFQPGDVRGIAQRLIWCADNRAEHRAVAQRARAVATSTLTISRTFTQYEKLFSSLCGDQRPR